MPPPGLLRPAADADADSGPLDVESLYRRHADAVAQWARRLGGPDIDLDDIVHEVFLVVHRRLKEWRGEAKITTWLRQITLRVVQQRRRHQRWLRLWPAAGVRAATPHAPMWDPADVPTEQPDALDLLVRRDSARALYQVLDGIGEKYRTVIILFELEGLSGEQIAALTGTSVANVWIRLHRGRQQMTRRLKRREEAGTP